MLGGVVERGEVGSHGQHSRHSQHKSRFHKSGHPLLPDGHHKVVHPHGHQHKGEVVGDLWVVGGNLQGGKECREQAAQNDAPTTQSVDHSAHQQGCIGEGKHLGDVPCSNNQYGVGGKTIGNGGHNGNQRVHSPQEQHRPETHQSEEYQHCGPTEGVGEVGAPVFDNHRGILDVNHIGGHTAEGVAGPLRVLACGLCLLDVATHTLILGDVAHRECLTLHLGLKVEQREEQEEHHRTNVWEVSQEYVSVVFHRLSNNKSAQIGNITHKSTNKIENGKLKMETHC